MGKKSPKPSLAKKNRQKKNVDFPAISNLETLKHFSANSRSAIECSPSYLRALLAMIPTSYDQISDEEKGIYKHAEAIIVLYLTNHIVHIAQPIDKTKKWLETDKEGLINLVELFSRTMDLSNEPFIIPHSKKENELQISKVSVDFMRFIIESQLIINHFSIKDNATFPEYLNKCRELVVLFCKYILNANEIAQGKFTNVDDSFYKCALNQLVVFFNVLTYDLTVVSSRSFHDIGKAGLCYLFSITDEEIKLMESAINVFYMTRNATEEIKKANQIIKNIQETKNSIAKALICLIDLEIYERFCKTNNLATNQDFLLVTTIDNLIKLKDEVIALNLTNFIYQLTINREDKIKLIQTLIEKINYIDKQLLKEKLNKLRQGYVVSIITCFDKFLALLTTVDKAEIMLPLLNTAHEPGFFYNEVRVGDKNYEFITECGYYYSEDKALQQSLLYKKSQETIYSHFLSIFNNLKENPQLANNVKLLISLTYLIEQSKYYYTHQQHYIYDIECYRHQEELLKKPNRQKIKSWEELGAEVGHSVIFTLIPEINEHSLSLVRASMEKDTDAHNSIMESFKIWVNSDELKEKIQSFHEFCEKAIKTPYYNSLEIDNLWEKTVHTLINAASLIPKEALDSDVINASIALLFTKKMTEPVLKPKAKKKRKNKKAKKTVIANNGEEQHNIDESIPNIGHDSLSSASIITNQKIDEIIILQANDAEEINDFFQKFDNICFKQNWEEIISILESAESFYQKALSAEMNTHDFMNLAFRESIIGLVCEFFSIWENKKTDVKSKHEILGKLTALLNWQSKYLEMYNPDLKLIPQLTMQLIEIKRGILKTNSLAKLKKIKSYFDIINNFISKMDSQHNPVEKHEVAQKQLQFVMTQLLNAVKTIYTGISQLSKQLTEEQFKKISELEAKLGEFIADFDKENELDAISNLLFLQKQKLIDFLDGKKSIVLYRSFQDLFLSDQSSADFSSFSPDASIIFFTVFKENYEQGRLIKFFGPYAQIAYSLSYHWLEETCEKIINPKPEILNLLLVTPLLTYFPWKFLAGKSLMTALKDYFSFDYSVIKPQVIEQIINYFKQGLINANIYPHTNYWDKHKKNLFDPSELITAFSQYAEMLINKNNMQNDFLYCRSIVAQLNNALIYLQLKYPHRFSIEHAFEYSHVLNKMIHKMSLLQDSFIFCINKAEQQCLLAISNWINNLPSPILDHLSPRGVWFFLHWKTNYPHLSFSEEVFYFPISPLLTACTFNLSEKRTNLAFFHLLYQSGVLQTVWGFNAQVIYAMSYYWMMDYLQKNELTHQSLALLLLTPVMTYSLRMLVEKHQSLENAINVHFGEDFYVKADMQKKIADLRKSLLEYNIKNSMSDPISTFWKESIDRNAVNLLMTSFQDGINHLKKNPKKLLIIPILNNIMQTMMYCYDKYPSCFSLQNRLDWVSLARDAYSVIPSDQVLIMFKSYFVTALIKLIPSITKEQISFCSRNSCLLLLTEIVENLVHLRVDTSKAFVAKVYDLCLKLPDDARRCCWLLSYNPSDVFSIITEKQLMELFQSIIIGYGNNKDILIETLDLLVNIFSKNTFTQPAQVEIIIGSIFTKLAYIPPATLTDNNCKFLERFMSVIPNSEWRIKSCLNQWQGFERIKIPPRAQPQPQFGILQSNRGVSANHVNNANIQTSRSRDLKK